MEKLFEFFKAWSCALGSYFGTSLKGQIAVSFPPSYKLGSWLLAHLHDVTLFDVQERYLEIVMQYQRGHFSFHECNFQCLELISV